MIFPPENVPRGIFLYVLATMAFSIADTIAKILSASLPVVQINWMRYLVFAGMAVALTLQNSGNAFHVRAPRMQIARGLCLVSSSLLFVFGIRRMGLAEAATISFVAPLLVTILSIPLLGEVVGLRRWAAVVAGMIGVLVVMRPGTGAFQPAALFGVASSTCWAAGLIMTRRMAGTERTATTLLWSACTGFLVLSLALPFDFVRPNAVQLALALAQGILSSVGQWLVVLAHRTAPASTLAPFSYGQLLWSVLAGFIVFSAFPDQWTILGAAIIIGSGLYSAHRERVRAGARREGRS